MAMRTPRSGFRNRSAKFDDTGKTAKGTNKAGQHVTLKCVTVTTEEWVATDKGLV
jgi:hypothetical protein